MTPLVQLDPRHLLCYPNQWCNCTHARGRLMVLKSVPSPGGGGLPVLDASSRTRVLDDALLIIDLAKGSFGELDNCFPKNCPSNLKPPMVRVHVSVFSYAKERLTLSSSRVYPSIAYCTKTFELSMDPRAMYL
jgi:hypothetical protein